MFEVGDEVVCVDDSPEREGALNLKLGETFVVMAIHNCGQDFGDFVVIGDSISIGRQCELVVQYCQRFGMLVPNFDIWDAARFRKVERKRTREELYALIGITDMVGARVPELV